MYNSIGGVEDTAFGKKEALPRLSNYEPVP